ncbi:hypothetical protein HanHA89_Chr15g0624091 [Helianthus annuus]|nr:hypothetical protein HanHA89_Chr15g0624091 [Helianthus annuus]
MVAAASIGVSVKTLFIVLYCVMAAAFVYLFMFGDLISCFDIHSRWFILIVADFTAYVVIGAWVAYKESNWIIAIVLMVTMYFIGRDVSGGPSVVATRVIFSLLSCLELGALIYTLIVELSPSLSDMDSIQGIKLDKCFLLDCFTCILYRYYTMCIHTAATVPTLTSATCLPNNIQQEQLCNLFSKTLENHLRFPSSPSPFWFKGSSMRVSPSSPSLRIASQTSSSKIGSPMIADSLQTQISC